jgi:hypothetical protein
MQILLGGTKLKKFHLTHHGLLNDEMEELKNLVKQTPILPNIVSFQWYFNVDYTEWLCRDYEQHKSLLETFRHAFPHVKVLGY